MSGNTMLIALCFSVASICSADINRFIEVTGTAMVEEKADQIQWVIKIQIIKPSLEDSKTGNDQAVGQLLNILRSLDVHDDDIEIYPILQGKNLVYEDGRRVMRGYYTTVQIHFLQKELSAYPTLVSKLAGNNDFEITSATFSNSRAQIQNRNALKDAVKAARNKAVYLAGIMNIKLGPVLEIAELSGFPRHSLAANLKFSESAGDHLADGVVRVEKSVRIKFAIE